MKQSIVTDLISDKARKLSYAPYSGAISEINETVKLYPAAWITPPRIVAVSGRNEGTISYAAKLHLMHITGITTNSHKEELWEQMRCDAMQIVLSLPLDPDVRRVSNVRCTPFQFSLTNHGEISLEVELEVEIHFFRNITE